jgi:cholesterol transport system auxiliary component
MNHLFIALFIMLSSACSVTPKQTALHDFGLQSSPTGRQSLTKTEITVDTPLWLVNDCIYYRLLYASATQLRCYNLDKWITPPAELFKQQLLASGKFSNHRLMIQLLDFEQQFDSPTQARVVLHFMVDVYTLNTQRLIATQDFRLEQVTPTPDAAGAVAGFAHLTQQANDKLQQWLLSVVN